MKQLIKEKDLEIIRRKERKQETTVRRDTEEFPGFHKTRRTKAS